jgi:ring-1,2-phenylacetyl-CoA epoxidase subunit PaaD
MVTAEAVWAALAEVPDPELPVVSLVELGVVREVSVEHDRVRVALVPTILGCPALEYMRAAAAAAVEELGVRAEVEVRNEPWTTDDVTPAGRAKLRQAGIGPPPLLELGRFDSRCPHCGSRETRLENLFGSTPCRSQRYCASCRQPYEQLKAL